MGRFEAIYFSGQDSRGLRVTVSFGFKRLQVHGVGLEASLDFPVADCRVAAPFGGGARRVRLPNGAMCETRDRAAIKELENQQGINRGLRLVQVLEARWHFILIAFAGILAFAWLMLTHGLPLLAELASDALPPSALERVSRHTLDALDRTVMAPSELSESERRRVSGILSMLRPEPAHGFSYSLAFRKSDSIGANAFALPSGVIVVTDDLVRLAGDEQEMAGVLLHEMAHVEHRHGVRSILQQAGAFLIVSTLAGDLTSISSMAGTLPTVLVESGYSRDFEREADGDAAAAMVAKGWGPEPFARMLRKLGTGHPDPPTAAVSSHPLIEERIRAIEAMTRPDP